MTDRVKTTNLTSMLHDARSRTLELIEGLTEEQLIGPQIATVNPLRWEIGHIAYFYEYFILRQMYGQDSLLGAQADKLYDSISVTHATRWNLPLLSTNKTLSYMQGVLDKLETHLNNHIPYQNDLATIEKLLFETQNNNDNNNNNNNNDQIINQVK